MSIATEQSRIIAEPAEAYHARSEISRGMLWDFFESPRLYEGRYVTGTVPPKEPTPLMIKGSAAHAALLEPRKFAEQYVVMPSFEFDAGNVTQQGKPSTSTATTYYQAKKSEFQKNHAGKNIVDQESFDMIQGMASGLARECGAWLDISGIVERTLTWTHPATGLPCRCRIDWARHTNKPSIRPFDLKGTGDPTPRAFRNRIIDGLWLQAAHYSEGLHIVTGMPVDDFTFVAVEFGPPHRCFTYFLDPPAMRQAVEAREQLMFDLSLAIGSGNFADPQEGKVLSVSLPDFAFKRGE